MNNNYIRRRSHRYLMHNCWWYEVLQVYRKYQMTSARASCAPRNLSQLPIRGDKVREFVICAEVWTRPVMEYPPPG